MENNKLAFAKANFILLAIGMLIVVVGFVLMSGGDSTEHHFDETIFSTMRVKVAPVVTLLGFLSIVGAILYKPKSKQ